MKNVNDENGLQSVEPKNTDKIHKFGELIQDIEIAMLSTVDEQGRVSARPMATQKTPFNGQLHFFTAEHSPKVDTIKHSSQVGLIYADPRQQRYVSVSGKAEISKDPELLKKFWHEAYKAWFPKGLEDPELSLICVDVDRAEYWDAHNSKMVHLFGWVQSMVTGKPLQPGQAGDHEKLAI